ncbi:MAG TPA: carboxypeptidase-like regulatory domain-containing protein [Gemmataceae bacterium]|jgi:hypothetical protein|nr:carboxypeptidase-like regulatory domain-containing protein [Gemmataceae bacterium]
MVLRLSLLIVSSILFLSATGCSSKGKPVKVAGVVTLDDQPLPEAFVQLVPLEGSGHVATGATDEQGRFELTTYNSRDGALPGEYKVVVNVGSAKDKAGPTPVPSNDPAARREGFQKAIKEQRERRTNPTPVESSIHPNYTSADKTPLRQKIPPDGSLRVELKKSGT